jgi:hypothetical protein
MTLSSWRYPLVALSLITLGACAGVPMQKADQPITAKPDEALVVLMRSSFVGGAVSASVFDVTGSETKFLGIIQNGTKIGYPVKPGEYTFMVVSEAADFMQAKVEAGKTYYALVTPRMGVWKARFSFQPLRQGDLAGSEFAGWNSGTHFVVNSPEALNWASTNAPDIATKRAEYWPQWQNKPADERAAQTLNPQDGR